MLKIVVKKEKKEIPEKETRRISLNIRKDVNDNIIISDSGFFDIIISLGKKEIFTYKKRDNKVSTELSYQVQKDFLDYLVEQGVVERDTMQGFGIFNALKAKLYLEFPNGESSLKLILMKIDDYMAAQREEERNSIDFVEDRIESLMNKDDLNPEEFDMDEIRAKDTQRVGQSYTGPIADFNLYFNE